jgi:hypothetical protein
MTKPMTPPARVAPYALPASAQTGRASLKHRAKTKPSAAPFPAQSLHLRTCATVPSLRRYDAQSLQNCPCQLSRRGTARRAPLPNLNSCSKSAPIKVRLYPPKCPPYFSFALYSRSLLGSRGLDAKPPIPKHPPPLLQGRSTLRPKIRWMSHPRLNLSAPLSELCVSALSFSSTAETAARLQP